MLIFYQTAQKKGMVASFSQRRKRIFTYRTLKANFRFLFLLLAAMPRCELWGFIFPIPRFRPSNIQKL
jgi:hypothetical protein